MNFCTLRFLEIFIGFVLEPDRFYWAGLDKVQGV